MGQQQGQQFPPLTSQPTRQIASPSQGVSDAQAMAQLATLQRSGGMLAPRVG